MGRKKTGVHYETRSGARPVEEWLEGMSPRVRTKLAKSMDRVEKFWGLSGLPFVSPLRDDLFEITVEVDKKWPRVIFFRYERDYIVYLHGFLKKKNKTPKNEIEIALKRKRDFHLQQEEKP